MSVSGVGTKMNLSRIKSHSILGKLLRAPLTLIPLTTVLPIVQGRLRGRKWVVGSSDHGCWLGSIEYEKQRRFCREVRPGQVVYDIGAHVGYYTLLASELVGSHGQVIAFEPVPSNLKYLKNHLAINHIENARVFDLVVSDRDGMCQFREGPTTTTGHIDPTGGVAVRTATLDSLVQRGEVPPPHVIKMDIEGAEYTALQGARMTLQTHRPRLFLATHGAEIQHRCYQLLRGLGYYIEPLQPVPLQVADELVAFHPED